MSKLKSTSNPVAPLKTGFQISNHFCRLCWRFTEEQMAGLVVEKRISGNRKHVPSYSQIARPVVTEKTEATARKILEKIIAESKAPESPHLEQLLYSQAHGYNYQLLEEKGLDSLEVQENLLDRIEQSLIDREWNAQVWNWDKVAEAQDNPSSNWPNGFIRKYSIKPLKPRMGDYKDDDERVSKNPSNTFCRDHNPHRSDNARRLYQNDRKRNAEYKKEINRLYSQCPEKDINRLNNEASLSLVDTLNARQALLKTAYDNVFSSTLEKIKQLKAGGKNQTEIADILEITRQAVSNALRREKKV